MEHFKETDISGFFVGSNGTIINETGIKYVSYKQAGVKFVGLEMDKNKRIMKKLSHLVYQFHINKGRPIDEELTVFHKNGDTSDFSLDNLSLKARGVRQSVDTSYYSNKGRHLENRIAIALHPGWLHLNSSKAS